jgi:hypothetical protein
MKLEVEIISATECLDCNGKRYDILGAIEKIPFTKELVYTPIDKIEIKINSKHTAHIDRFNKIAIIL